MVYFDDCHLFDSYILYTVNQDKEINPEIAKIQIKILDEKQIWLQDNEVANYLKNNSRQ